MGILNDADRTFLREQLASELRHPVRIRLFTQPVSRLFIPGRPTCETCPEAEALMTEVAELSDQVYLETIDVSAHPEAAREAGVALVPTVTVDGGADAGVRFIGLPDGYEFTSFVETLLAAGAEPGHGLSAETVQRLSELTEDIDIKTFVTPT
jgi:alkyl hydroperoxide reductase subunit AhpF